MLSSCTILKHLGLAIMIPESLSASKFGSTELFPGFLCHDVENKLRNGKRLNTEDESVLTLINIMLHNEEIPKTKCQKVVFLKPDVEMIQTLIRNKRFWNTDQKKVNILQNRCNRFIRKYKEYDALASEAAQKIFGRSDTIKQMEKLIKEMWELYYNDDEKHGNGIIHAIRGVTLAETTYRPKNGYELNDILDIIYPDDGLEEREPTMEEFALALRVESEFVRRNYNPLSSGEWEMKPDAELDHDEKYCFFDAEAEFTDNFGRHLEEHDADYKDRFQYLLSTILEERYEVTYNGIDSVREKLKQTMP